MVAPEFKMDLNRSFHSTGGFSLRGWVRDQEDALVTVVVPALEDPLLTDLHSGHSLKLVLTDSSFSYIYICRALSPYPMGFSALP